MGDFKSEPTMPGIIGELSRRLADAEQRLLLGAAPLVTSLPSSPADGQEVTFVADAAAGVVWRFRYNAGSASPLKWEAVGEPTSLAASTDNDEATASATYVALTTAVAITLPLAGDYELEHGCNAYLSAVGVNYQTVQIGASVPGNDADAITLGTPVAGTFTQASPSRRVRKTGMTAASVVSLRYHTSGQTGNFRWRWLRATPVRVG